jgi:hypothetical protein
VDGTGSGSCLAAGFGISGVEPLGSATAVLVRHFKQEESSTDTLY